MKLCETCKHWEKVKEGYERAYGLGVCKNIPTFWDATRWDEYGENRKLVDKYKDTKAFAQDGSDYVAYVLTDPTFGCVSHEKK